MQFVNLNGDILPINQAAIPISNRGFKYGDGFFESIRMVDGKMPLWDLHMSRLFETMDFLEFEKPKSFNAAFLKNEVVKLTGKTFNNRLRITITRAEAGLYTPQSNHFQYLIESSPLPELAFQLNDKGLELGLFDKIKLPHSALSNHKTCNAIPYILASNFKAKSPFDDVFLLNTSDRIAEASSSNIFIIKGQSVYTPSLSEGCLNGVMRKYLIELLPTIGFSLIENKLELEQLESADEVFLTNAIQGIKKVTEFRKQRFGKQKIRLIFDEIKKRL